MENVDKLSPDPRSYIAHLQQLLATLNLAAIKQVADVLIEAFTNNQTVFICGNGGSASTASHMAADLGKNTVTPGKSRLRVLCLNDNMAWFSALGNDLGYENVFTEQIANLLRPGDVLIAISASGNSPNVVKAAEFVREHDGKVVALVGFKGGRLKEIAHLAIHLTSHEYGPVEDGHLIINHILVGLLREHIHTS